MAEIGSLRLRTKKHSAENFMNISLCGDVMTGRGIDQVLPHPSDPVLYEDYLTDARDYVKLAEEANGPINRPVSYSYVWGDAIEEFDSMKSDMRIINLETSITKSNEYWKGKGYFAIVDPFSGRLQNLQMTPMQVRRFRANRASPADAVWLKNTLNREGRRFGTGVELTDGNKLILLW